MTVMAAEIATGHLTHLEIDAEEGTTTATLVFPTPDTAYNIASLVHRLVDGIEVLVNVEEDDT